MDFGTRLHRTPKEFKKKELTDFELTTVVSTLPPSTIQWIKSRRNFDSKSKVILSHYRESQLREIFTGLDVGKNGAIDLEELKEAVAVKTLQFDVEMAERVSLNGLFLNEARAAAGLSHPHIVTIHDAGLSAHGVYIAMERLYGRDLPAERFFVTVGGMHALQLA
jgi:hypothetical protein